MSEMRLSFARGDNGAYELTSLETGASLYVGLDWDFPGIASCFGYRPCESCGETDGTIDCAHHTASEMIGAARDWLDEHVGETCEDPGYFDD